ncbi:MAG: hypothetical protein GY705_15370 [Bacteroidetes bacterium]|nr:hypothetical protein [Bacteroidota bacterium]
MKGRIFEIFLAEIIAYFLLWLWNDYVATLLCLTLACIFLFILIISWVVEWIEPSRVPKWYFHFMILSVLAPVLVSAIFLGINGGEFEWLEK